jgi:uncharacterized integral membrane protein
MLKVDDVVEIDVKKEKEDNGLRKGLRVAWTVIAVQCIIGIVIFIFI